MRSKCFASLLVPVLLLIGSTAGCSTDIRAREGRSAATKKEYPTWEISGWGETNQDANDNALGKARTEVIAYLSGEGLCKDWNPTKEDIQFLVRDTKPGETKEIPDVGPVKQSVLKVELRRPDYYRFVKQDRQHYAGQRMQSSLRVVLGLVALFTGLSLYFRLEGATKGYATLLLRLGVVGLVGAAVAASFFVIS